MLVGDIMGHGGREIFQKYTKALRQEKGIDLVIVNGENASGGRGLSKANLAELIGYGADIITSGNHIWDNKDAFSYLDSEPYVLRPLNYPEGTIGKGMAIYPYKAREIAVINLMGRVYMPPVDCPFQAVDKVLSGLRADIVIVDFHAEATSEKIAMGHYLTGRATVVVGTHTHVQTADERIIDGQTAYLTDLGMTGPYDSVIGMEKTSIINKFLTGLPCRHEVAKGACMYSALIVDIGSDNLPKAVERVLIRE